MHSLGVPQVGYQRLPVPSSGSEGLHQANILPGGMGQLMQTLFHVCPPMQGER